MAKYLKWYILFGLTLFTGRAAYSQLSTGESGLYIKTGGHLYTAGLEWVPSMDMEIKNTNMSISSSPITSDNGISINSVYQFSQPVLFTGTLRLQYKDSELNGNTAEELALAYKASESDGFVVSTNSLSNTNSKTIEEVFTSATFHTLTAINKTSTLPLELFNFSVKAENNSSNISWITASEVDVSHFSVLKSTDGKSFSLLTNIPLKGGNNNIYTVYDNSPSGGINYYQLTQYDKNGTVYQLGIRSLRFEIEKDKNFTLFPTPGKGPFYLNINKYSGSKLNLAFFSSNGKLLKNQTILITKGKSHYLLPIEEFNTKGVYILQIKEENGFEKSLKLVIE